MVQHRCSLRNGAARRIAGYATLGAILDDRGRRDYLAARTSPAEALRDSTHTGRPLGTRILSKGWNATPAVPSSFRKAVARAKLPATHGNQLSIFSGKSPLSPVFAYSQSLIARNRRKDPLAAGFSAVRGRDFESDMTGVRLIELGS
jgi:hypothetical protein